VQTIHSPQDQPLDAPTPAAPEHSARKPGTAAVVDWALLMVLLAALCGVRQWDHRFSLSVVDKPQQAEPATTPAAPNSGLSEAKPPLDAIAESLPAENEPADTAHNENSEPRKAPDDPSAKQGTTGIIASGFEPFDIRLLDDTPSPPVVVSQLPETTPPQITAEQIADTPLRGIEEQQKVEFFQSETKAVSVGFVVDCSSSMEGDKFRAVCDELAKSISNLSEEQLFHVVFFNDSFFPMSGASQTPQLLPASQHHKQEILRFLGSAQAFGGTNPEPALQFVARLRPEVIYLLTDGEFSPLKQQTYNSFEQADIEVHTIGFQSGLPIPILQDIANLTGGTYRSVTMTSRSPALFLADPGVVRQALQSPDSQVRRGAVAATVARQLPFVSDVIAMLADTDSGVRKDVHDSLRQAAHGVDFGPTSDADVPGAVQRWTLWWSMRQASRTRLLNSIGGDDMNARWVAAVHARQASINAPDEFVAAMRTSPEPICGELRGALVACCDGKDFGPAPGATPDEIQSAADRWSEYFIDVREKAERARLEKRRKAAAEKLRLTKQLIDVNPDAVERRCKELLRDYPETPAATEAQHLLDDMQRQDDEEGE
jgi:hypothetical protein